jgi:hypothetical protein
VLRITVCALALLALIGVALQVSHHRRQSPGFAESQTAADARSAALDPSEDTPSKHISEAEILAKCHPHLGPNATMVPNINVSATANPLAVNLKVRFWVNGNGFVTQAFVIGGNVYSVEDREDALHYIRGLTFTVPNTAECRSRQMELIGNFMEARGAGGDWSTTVDLHPRYSWGDGRVIQSR